MMMEQVRNKIKFPGNSYEVPGIKEYTFEVEPLSSDCVRLIDRLQELGADVNISPEEFPTRVSISYAADYPRSIDRLGHSVVGARLELTLNLLDNNNSRHERRLRDFLACLSDVSKGIIPDGAIGVEWVQVINKYQF